MRSLYIILPVACHSAWLRLDTAREICIIANRSRTGRPELGQHARELGRAIAAGRVKLTPKAEKMRGELFTALRRVVMLGNGPVSARRMDAVTAATPKGWRQVTEAELREEGLTAEDASRITERTVSRTEFARGQVVA